MYTKQEVLNALLEKFDEPYENNENFIGSWDDIEYKKNFNLNINDDKVEATFVEGETGGEGKAEYCYIVIKVGNQYFHKEGYYASHHGTDWDGDFDEVEPYEVMVTKYRVK